MNGYCLDKNYGGVLIIWDKLLGTYATERKDAPVAYGLLDQLQTYDMIEIHVNNSQNL